jgi:hypothetical protein
LRPHLLLHALSYRIEDNLAKKCSNKCFEGMSTKAYKNPNYYFSIFNSKKNNCSQ